MRQLFVLCSLLLTIGGASARAEEHHSHVLLGVGAMDAHIFHSGEPLAHLGPYGTVDVKYVRYISDNWMVVPGVSFDWAPGGNQWGFSGSLTFEVKLFEYLRLDFSFLFMHDQNGHAEFFTGGGIGLTFKVTNWFVVELLPALLVPLNGEGGLLFAPSIVFFLRF